MKEKKSGMATFVQATDNSFDPEVLKCDIPVIADFWAEWCAPCKTIDAHLGDIAARYPEQLKIVKVDIEANSIVTSNYNVLNLPTLILFKFGQPVERMVGALPKQAILDKVLPYLDS
ncbi:MAG: thiol reductase thioredoxin [Chloroflexi bacterium]|nr:thiol reductase thioredoxin [Chloroflexota bacterium]